MLDCAETLNRNMALETFETVKKSFHCPLSDCVSMSFEERTVEALSKKINILEARLSSERKLKQNHSDNLSSLFSPKGESVYNYLIGDAYFMLWSLDATSLSTHGDSVGDRSVWSFEASVTSASTCLDIIDPLRLLCIYSWCNSLIHIRNQYVEARSIADQTFNLASLHTNNISQEAIDLLQRLRDDIMSYQPKGDKSSAAKSTAPPVIVSPDLITKTATMKVITEDTGGAMVAGVAGYNGDDIPIHRREIAQCALSVRRVISIPVPVQLDVVSSAALILKALDKIFRTYVRGTALPGQLSGGNTVEFDGTTLTFRNFILHGPYISWKGFVHFLLDFAVAAPPSQSSRLGRSFLAEVLDGNTARLPGGGELAAGATAGGAGAAAGAAATARAVVEPVTMLEAAVVFIESAKSITPALVLSKFLKMYEEMAREIESEPWASVHAWAEEPTRRDWDINSGINFMQFVDCLGKLGMVAYKAARYTEMLPTAADKIEHFLSAHLGLTDQRKWQRKVEAKLKKIKSVIKEVGDLGTAKRPNSPGKGANK